MMDQRGTASICIRLASCLSSFTFGLGFFAFGPCGDELQPKVLTIYLCLLAPWSVLTDITFFIFFALRPVSKVLADLATSVVSLNLLSLRVLSPRYAK